MVRDLFTEDFGKLVVSGDEAWDMVDEYVKHVAPELEERLEHYASDEDVFAAYRIDEQIAKGLDRKVWLPSGGSLIIDRTEAMTVVDVNTGKFTGSGGNLEETVTKNNLEAAEEMVRQLRLRDIGGIIVVDFIDMVLESNRDLVLRRLVECLGRDRTRHQVAEVTSLGLVQMTRKRIGTGLLEAFSENCEHCQGRGLIVHHEPVEPKKKPRTTSRAAAGAVAAAAARTATAAATATAGTGTAAGAARQGVALAPGHRGDGQARATSLPTRRPSRPPSRHRRDGPDAGGARTHPSPLPSRPPRAGHRAGHRAGRDRPHASRWPCRRRSAGARPRRPTSTTHRADDPSRAPEPIAEPAGAGPAGPRLVTSSRRRRASRPAGPPAGRLGAVRGRATGAELRPQPPVEGHGRERRATDVGQRRSRRGSRTPRRRARRRARRTCRSRSSGRASADPVRPAARFDRPRAPSADLTLGVPVPVVRCPRRRPLAGPGRERAVRNQTTSRRRE